MTTLFGIIRPTSLYPRLRYNGTSFDSLEGIADWLPSSSGLRGANLVSTGEIEYLFARIEEAVQLTVVCLPSQYRQLRAAIEQSLLLGTQFEAWVDRFTGSCWMFSETLDDQNGLALVLNTGTAAYVDVGEQIGRALNLGASQSLSVPIAQATASPTRTGYDDPMSPAEGVLLLDLKPTWAANDGALHVLLDTGGTTANRLRLTKTAGNALQFEILDAAAGSKIVSGTPTWAANSRVEIMARWTTGGALALWYAVNEGVFVPLTTASGAGTGVLGALTGSLFVGSDNAAANFAPGVYQTLQFHARAFDAPHESLRRWRTVWRNYFAFAEITSPGFQPARFSLDPQVWTYGLTIRNGVAHVV